MKITNANRSNYSDNSRLNFGKRDIKLSNIKLPDTIPAEALVFPLLCGYHAYEDYQKAPQETKKETLVMRLFILTGTSIGALLGHKGLEKALESNKKMKQMKKDIISSVGVPLGGILGGFVAGSFAEGFCSFVLPPERKNKRKTQKSHYPSLRFLHKKNQENKKETSPWVKKLGVISTTVAGAALGNIAYVKIVAKNKDFQNAMYTKAAQRTLNLLLWGVGAFSGLLVGDMIFDKKQSELNKKTIENADFLLSEMSSTVGAFDSVAENDFKQRAQKGFYGIISSVIVPSAIVLPVSQYLRNYIKDDQKFEKHWDWALKHISNNKTTQKMVFEKGISVPLAISTYMAGEYVAKIVDEKVTHKFMENKFWDELEKLKQKALEESMKNLEKKDTEKLQKSLQELAEFEKMAQQVRATREETL